MSGKLITEITITNTGNVTAKNITATIPLCYSGSPYQTTRGYRAKEQITRLPDLAPGQVEIIELVYNIRFRNVKYPSSRIVKRLFDRHKGSGNCRELARRFISDCLIAGLAAREVIGWARPTRILTDGDLKGCRHSWAEVMLDGVWTPADLTFQQLAKMEGTHIIADYKDRSIRVRHNGGKLSVKWFNEWVERRAK